MTTLTLEDILIEECGLTIEHAARNLREVRVETPEVPDLLRCLAGHGATVTSENRTSATLTDVHGNCVSLHVVPTLDEWLKACCHAILSLEAHEGTACLTPFVAGTDASMVDYDPAWWAARASVRLDKARAWLDEGKLGESMAPVGAHAEVLAMLVGDELDSDWKPPMQWILMTLAVKPGLLESARALSRRDPVRVSSHAKAGRGRG